MNLKSWYADRGLRFVYQRGARLLSRYDFVPERAMRRIERCLATLAKYGCAPTFPAPGILVERYPEFFRRLQDEGAEIAVHGYQHVNLNAFPVEEARRQVEKAAYAFKRMGLQAYGFRNPYINFSDALLDALPTGLFSYSSNQAIHWHALHELASQKNGIYNTLGKFYRARDSAETACVPWNRSHMVEIPVCIPDDLQFLDGLTLGAVGLARAWQEMLYQTHRRGELFTLLFHTELAEQCEQPFVELLRAARACQPSVWIARLHEISAWWEEKSAFKIELISNSDDKVLKFSCTPRATILVRGFGSFAPSQFWDGAYYRLTTNTLTLPEGVLPFVGLHRDAPNQVVTFLKEQGYIIQIGEMASSCDTYLDAAILSRLCSQVQIIDYIEKSHAPLVRFWRWPDGAKSALCITGDLDALSLMDYASRLLPLKA